MHTTKNSSADSFAGNQIFAQGIEQAQQVLLQRTRPSQPAGTPRRNDTRGVLARAGRYARRHPLAAMGTAAVAAYLVNRIVRSR